MRGKDPHYAKNTSWNRITPAYAGKSARVSILSGSAGDHPRLCGEKVVASVVLVAVSGITPAYAGKRRHCDDHGRGKGDHPRLCGEKAAAWRKIKMEVGSPPPMRGKGAKCVKIDHN